MPPTAISVTQFVSIINETLNFAYPQVVIEGEVSSFKINQGKWVFFDLKDDANIINCFMSVYQLKLPLEDGMKVRVTGSPKVTKYSKFSFTVRVVEISGEGALRRAMELLKAKLLGEGLFDAARKRPLPAFPTRIGLITSGTSAAYSDFIKILAARWGNLEVLLADVQVQGEAAADQVIGAIDYFNNLPHPADVLVIIRGGGSLEDLQTFSTEPVARAVAASRTPTVVGVGHEIDVSLADFAADVRAATPTDAARLVVPDRGEIGQRVMYLEQLTEASLRKAWQSRIEHIDRSMARLERYLRHPLERINGYLASLWRGFDQLDSSQRASRERVVSVLHRLSAAESNTTRTRRHYLDQLERVLAGYGPQATLDRGYAIVRGKGRIIKDNAGLQPGDELMIQLAKGQLTGEVRHK